MATISQAQRRVEEFFISRIGIASRLHPRTDGGRNELPFRFLQ
jgi:hypothetical protein